MPEPQIESVEHPSLGTLKFPVDMGPDERNEAIDRAMMGKAQNPGANVAKPDLGGMIRRDESDARMAGVPGGSPNTPPATDTMGKVAGVGIGAAALGVGGPALMRAIPPIAAAGGKFVAKHPIATMAGIEAAKHIPVVGKYAAHIPSWLPLLAGGKSVAPEAAEEAEAGSAVPIRPQVAAPEPAPAPAPRSEWPPVQAPPVIQRGPIPGSAADLAETKNIQSQVRDAAEGEDRARILALQRERFPGRTKFDLTNEPVKFTKTPGVSASGRGAPKAGTTVPAPDEDLEPILRKSVKAAEKAKKAKR